MGIIIVPTIAASDSEAKCADGLAPARRKEEITWSWFYEVLIESSSLTCNERICLEYECRNYASLWGKTGTEPSRKQVITLNLPRPLRMSCLIWAREQPIVISCSWRSLSLMLRQKTRKIRAHRRSPVRGRGLHFDQSTDHHTALNMHFNFFPFRGSRMPCRSATQTVTPPLDSETRPRQGRSPNVRLFAI